jgi:hypothetical protein
VQVRPALSVIGPGERGSRGAVGLTKRGGAELRDQARARAISGHGRERGGFFYTTLKAAALASSTRRGSTPVTKLQ